MVVVLVPVIFLSSMLISKEYRFNSFNQMYFKNESILNIFYKL